MAIREFFAFDNQALVVDGTSPSLAPGSAIINESDTPNGTIFRYTAGQGSRISLNDTGGSSNTFEDDNAANHVIVNGKGMVANGQTVESESFHTLQQIDDLGNPVGAPITLWVFSQGGVTQNVWGFGTNAVLVDGARYQKTGGSITGGTGYGSFVPCFTPGTRVTTITGEKPIEDIVAGDRVLTRDNGFQVVRWAGRRAVTARELATSPRLRPVRIARGAFGENVPSRDMHLSPQHRVLLTDRRCGVYFEEGEMFAPADFLCGVTRGVARDEVPEVTYVHILFDRHEIVLSDGMWSESFHPGTYSVGAMGAAQRAEILALFPQLCGGQEREAFGAARPSIKRREAILLAS
ncbi:Hint domain-containing protein [Anianabacter salinae]|uniref:Hint domain-containing protein n=1 Tax=Anianabacter salinae TaxID=2851023 RepID=UPI00225E01A7|nr:Hint domain-containing protein [Anianabacter salinae]MBV0912928.1 Hint domain-containing protein [Anianabacter salinae]